MALTISGEKYATRLLSGERAERVYIIRSDDGTDTDADARDLLLATAPTAVLTKNNSVTIPIDNDYTEVEEIEDGIWHGIATYRRRGSKVLESGQFKLSYDISTADYTLYQSRSTVSKTVSPNSPFPVIDYGQAINVTDDGVEGVAYKVPVMQGNVEKIFDESLITESYIGNLYATVGTVNSSVYRGLQAGEGLLTGVDGSDNGDGTWTFNFSYAISPNETNLNVGNEIIVPSKRGWDYLWVRYYEEDNGQGVTKVLAGQANVEVIYRYTNWGVLNV